jgi:antitoxin Phd
LDFAGCQKPHKVTRRGKWVSVVLSVEDYERLQRLDVASGPSLPELFLQMPQDDEGYERMRLELRDVSCAV